MARSLPEIPNASMADIAFLLLTFFLVTTTMPNDKGLTMQLPPPPESQPEEVKIQERNIFKIQVNSSDALLVEGEAMSDVTDLKDMIKRFVLNNGRDPSSSDNPEKAIVSLKTDRGTTYKRFIQILDLIQAAYYDIYADQAGLSNSEFRKVASNLRDPYNKALYNKGREGIPMSISIAEPTKAGG